MTVVFRMEVARRQAKMPFEPFHQWILPGGSPSVEFYRLNDGYLLRFPNLADFLVTVDAAAVSCWPSGGATQETLEHLYLNQVLPLALSRRGKLVFHGSAIEIDAAAVAFVGESGLGKSTLAASFAASGVSFLADDGLVLQKSEEEFLVLPGHPSIRLWEDSELEIMPARQKVPGSGGSGDKSRFAASAGLPFCDQPRQLRCVFFLQDEGVRSITIAPVSGRDAIIKLIRNSFLLDIDERGMLAEQFHGLSGLAQRVSFYRLDYPRHFEELDRLRRRILELATLAPAA